MHEKRHDEKWSLFSTKVFCCSPRGLVTVSHQSQLYLWCNQQQLFKRDIYKSLQNLSNVWYFESMRKWVPSHSPRIASCNWVTSQAPHHSTCLVFTTISFHIFGFHTFEGHVEYYNLEGDTIYKVNYVRSKKGYIQKGYEMIQILLEYYINFEIFQNNSYCIF